jgi:hypothetical protein
MLGSRAPIVIFAEHIEQRLMEDPLNQSEGCFIVGKGDSVCPDWRLFCSSLPMCHVYGVHLCIVP